MIAIVVGSTVALLLSDCVNLYKFTSTPSINSASSKRRNQVLTGLLSLSAPNLSQIKLVIVDLYMVPKSALNSTFIKYDKSLREVIGQVNHL